MSHPPLIWVALSLPWLSLSWAAPPEALPEALPKALPEAMSAAAPTASASTPATAPAMTLVEARAELPLSLWQQIQAELERAPTPPSPPRSICFTRRHLDGRFAQGVLEATLTVDLEVLTSGRVEAPIIDADASILSARLDGQPVSLRAEGGLYMLDIEGVGRHQLQLKLLQGQARERFERAVRFQLPQGGPTRLDLRVEETGIEATLARGALRAEEEGGVTHLRADLGRADHLDLRWRPRVARDAASQAPRYTIKPSAIAIVGAALITTVSRLEVEIEGGALSALELPLPADLEIIKVEGEAVLQWRSVIKGGDEASAAGARLRVLLKAPMTEGFEFTIHAQSPVEGDEAPLRLPIIPPEVARRGWIGIRASAGLELHARRHAQVTPRSLNKLPRDLVALSGAPLLLAFERGEAAPEITLGIKRHQQVQLTDSVIDELECSTVLLEDGGERTKLTLRMRNNARQHLRLTLPEGAILNQALMDGRPLRVADEDQALLIPLKQSRRLSADEVRRHVVRPGETLGSIAYTYYSNPQHWQTILDQNNLYGEDDLRAGQVLEIPPLKGAVVEEARFIVELAYALNHDQFRLFGRQDLRLPALDLPTLKATWHVYLPREITPLSFNGNFVQYTAIRYDPFRRAKGFFERALQGGEAWAGSYKSILRQRQQLYREDQAQISQQQAPLASLPLVGARYRFKRLLLGEAQGRVTLTYLTVGAAKGLQIVALLLSLLLTLWIAWPRRRAWAWLALIPAAAALAILGHFIIGAHRRVIWGIDLGLIMLLIWHGLPALKRRALAGPWAPWRGALFAGLSIPALSFAQAHPLLLSLTLLALLGPLWLYTRGRAL
ncbi:LysM peptidoglycan-binding domain-containing protein [Myxococcota bacterium]|nr:LysM peptidoglycan-binding domain-containing protein [Myxococcota bacterium]